MRGNKLISKILLALTILCVGVVSVFMLPTRSVKNVFAENEDTTKYKMEGVVSQKYDDNVIFSAEHVYYNWEDRTTPIYYSAYSDDPNATNQPTSNILGYQKEVDKNSDGKADVDADGKIIYNHDNYFANYYGNAGNKKLVYDGDYVMVNDTTIRNAYTQDGQTELNQGIMLTLGGYIYEATDEFDASKYTIHQNSETYKIPNPSGDDFEYGYSANLQRASLTVKRYDSQGNETLVPSTTRTFHNTESGNANFDALCFIDAKLENEGYYEVLIEYTQENSEHQTHKFGFFMLLDSSYDKDVEINGQNYSVKPTVENATGENEKYKATTSGHIATLENERIVVDGKTIEQFPTITYDYRHYELSYTYSTNDSVENVSVIYDQTSKQLVMTTKGTGEPDIEYFNCESGNNIVSLLFISRGNYRFNFSYVYYYKGEKLAVNVSDITLELTIDGYELKYHKTGYTSSDFRSVKIAHNGTTIVPVNGYQDNNIPSKYAYTDLGYMYSLEKTTNYRTGTIIELIDGDITSLNGQINANNSTITLTDLTNINYYNTDQYSLWFETNNSYDLNESGYIYNVTPFKSDTYSMNSLTKVTRFSKVGYYIVRIGYKIGNDTNYQYFAFRITSYTANLKMYAIDSETISSENFGEGTRIYSNQFTNKNVYADWEDTTTFESKQTISLYRNKTNQLKFATVKELTNFADGGVSSYLEKVEYEKGDVLTKSGSYLIRVNVVGKQSEADYFFTIDKEPISGLDVLGISSANLGDSSIYMVEQDANGNSVSYMDKLFINEDFTVWWNDKTSGAKITAKYTYTPFDFKATNDVNEGTLDNKSYKHVFSDYIIGSTSTNISINKPTDKKAMVEAKNVLAKAGIYWFNIEDEAGNSCNYAVIYDNTNSKVFASSENHNLENGDTVSTDVTFSWGSHKAIRLDEEEQNIDNISEDTIWKKIYEFANKGDNYYNYYNQSSSNKNKLETSVKMTGTATSARMYLTVKNEYAELEAQGDLIIRVNSDGNIVVSDKYINNVSYSSSEDKLDSTKKYKLVITSPYEMVVKVNSQALNYSTKVYPEDVVDLEKIEPFYITINPDKSEGQVWTETETTYSDKKEMKITSYNDSNFEDSNIFDDSQASNGMTYYFEWLAGIGTNSEVSKVSYIYYPLLSQQELDNLSAEDIENNSLFPYSKDGKEFVVYDYENNINKTSVKDRTDKYGTKTFYRTPLNTGYVIYYNNLYELQKGTGTLPGLYVITREYKSSSVDANDGKVRKYAFIVDRNQIVDYSTSDISVKTIGKYIEMALQGKPFSNFNQEEEKYNSHTIHLKTNKLPLVLNIPTGKYVSYNNGIQKTSYSKTGRLSFSLTFYDEYNYLGIKADNKTQYFDLFENIYVESENGYITYKLTSDSMNGEQSFIGQYLNACKQTGNEWLSLPGYYIITIKDNVGLEAKGDGVTIISPNEMTIGINVYTEKPSVDFSVGQKVESVNKVEFVSSTQENNVEPSKDVDYKLTSSKAYVKYVLPKVDEDSYNAQIDNNYIVIERENLATGKKETYYNSSKSGEYIINKDQRFMLYENGDKLENYINDNNGNVTVWLDTGLVLDNGQIVDYNEYKYTVHVRYQTDDGKYNDCYIYNILKDNKTVQYYETIIEVNIDRTASLDNVRNILGLNENADSTKLEQKDFLEKYFENNSTKEYNDLQTDVNNKLNKLSDTSLYNTVAFKGDDEEYYFGVVNKLYYHYIEQGEYQKAEDSIYAIAVDSDENISLNDSTVYFRKLYGSSNNADKRMALLPITSRYFGANSNEFILFNHFEKDGFRSITNSGETRWENISASGYYEIIELDNANNFMQYVVYIKNNDTQNADDIYSQDATLKFKDGTETTFDLKFNFAEQDNAESGIYRSTTDDNGQPINESISSIGLIVLNSVEDMFGNSCSNEESIAIDTSKDWFYKVVLSDGETVKEMYLNYNNLNLAKFIKDNMAYGNYELTLTTRYNQSLTLEISNFDGGNYNLNYNNFEAYSEVSGENVNWYIFPDRDLNVYQEKEDGTKFKCYVKKISLTNIATGLETIFEFNIDGKVIKVNGEDNDKKYSGLEIDKKTNVYDKDNNVIYVIECLENDRGEPSSRIKLESGVTYTANIEDIQGNKKTKTLRAYDSEISQVSKIEFVANESYSSGINYTAGKVIVRYKSSSIGTPTIKIKLNDKDWGVYNYNDTNKTYSVNFDGKNYDIIKVEQDFEEEGYYLIEFLPIEVGVKLAFDVGFLLADESDANYKFVIDNRVPKLSITNNYGEDKSDIIKSKLGSLTNGEIFDLTDSNDIKTLFDIAPNKTLPETAILNWTNLEYLDSNESKYFVPNLKLVKFNSLTDYEITILDGSSKSITPRENELGRYVLLYALMRPGTEQIIYYKAYAFNISSVASAMYEVRKVSDDKEVEVGGYIKGQELLACMTENIQTSLASKFNISEDDKLYNMSLPIYIANEDMYLKLGGADVQSIEFVIDGKNNPGLAGYILYIYKVSNKVYTTYVCFLQAEKTSSICGGQDDFKFETDSLVGITSKVSTNVGTLEFLSYNNVGVDNNSSYMNLIKQNKIYLDIYYRTSTSDRVNLGQFFGTEINGRSYLTFSQEGSYDIYVKDMAGNTRIWNPGQTGETDHFTLTILTTALITVNGEAPIEFAYYNEPVTVAVAFNNNINFYESGSVTMEAYYNYSSEEYITTEGGRNTNAINSFTFSKYGTYRVVINAKHKDTGAKLTRTYIFSIINPNEARLGLDFTTINNYNITKIVNNTTGMDVTDTFNFLLNEAYIYSKLITYDRLASKKAFGETMGKQEFEVFYQVKENDFLPLREESFKFTINNKIPSLECSVAPGKSTTKKIKITFNPLTIYRQVGDCYIKVNDNTKPIYEINEKTAEDTILSFTLSEPNVYYIKLMNNSNKVMASFMVTIKEPLNTWSIVLIVGIILVVIGIVAAFIIFRTKMKVR